MENIECKPCAEWWSASEHTCPKNWTLQESAESLAKERDALKLQVREKDEMIRRLCEALTVRRAMEPKHSDLDHTCPECEFVAEIIHSEQSKKPKDGLQNRDLQQLLSEVATMFELTTRQDIDGLLRARIQEALAGVALKPKGVCTHNCLDKDYSTGHTLCMKELPCPDHDEKKPVDERACCTCGGAGLRDIGHAPCHSTADRHFCVSCKTTPVSEAGRTCVVCIAHNWPNNDTIKREDVPAPSEECTCDGGFDPNPGCPLHD